MILADSSAWIEYLRRTGSTANRRIRHLLGEGDGVATTDPVIMEVLAGALDDVHLQSLRKLLASCSYLPAEGPHDFEAAAGISRACRSQGTTIRNPTDCLIAAVAICAGASILHADRDFDAIAHHLPLKIA